MSRRRYKTKHRLGFISRVHRWIINGTRRNKYESHSVEVALQSQPIIEQLCSRVPLNITLDDALQSPMALDRLRRQLYETKSTLDNFNNYLDISENMEDTAGFGILYPLFGLVRADLMEFIKQLHTILDEINFEILDDTKMEERLTIWRQIITRAQFELPEIWRSMVQFFTFLPSADQSSDGDSVREVFERCSSQVDEIIQRLQTVSSSLTSNMALLDSRRSIAEARSVTKLTELAFLFIPLTFAATLLGMQIDQFENRVPLSTFIILGVSFTGFSYAVRLAIRSSWVETIMQSSKESIKIYADRQQQPVQRGYVPSSLFLRWLCQLSWWKSKAAFFIIIKNVHIVASFIWRLASLILSPFGFYIKPLFYVGLICIIPLATLWTRELDWELKVIITIALLSSVSVPVMISCWVFADPERRKALPRLLSRELELFKKGNSVLFSWILRAGSAIIFLVPIVLLWTRSTAPALKVLLTAVLILILVVCFIGYGIYILVELAQRDRNEGESETDDDSYVED